MSGNIQVCGKNVCEKYCLSRFNMIAAVEQKFGIGNRNGIPWKNKEDMKFFKNKTLGSTVIMGRKTYESIGKPLPGRHNVVLSSVNIDNVTSVKSLKDALKMVSREENVYIIGGEQVYREALDKYGYLCDKILLSRIEQSYDCDKYFPFDLLKRKSELISASRYQTFTLEEYSYKSKHQEAVYLDLLKKICDEGEIRMDRTGTGTKSIFGVHMEFDLREGFPLITTKRTWFDGIKKELLFFLSGKTDTKILEDQGVKIWTGNTTKDFLSKRNLSWREGDMGPGYSHQWRHAGAKYTGCDSDYKNTGVDQIKLVIDGIKNDPFGRRHIVNSWNVEQLNEMALPPCHCLFQFNVGSENGKQKYLDCSMYQRSADMFLGVPFNIASYALLMVIIGNITGLVPRKFIHNIGDAHIYLNHTEQVQEQISRTPLPFCNVILKRDINDVDDIKLDDIELQDYVSWPTIKAPMSI